MATRTIAGKTVQVNEEGYMTNPANQPKRSPSKSPRKKAFPSSARRIWRNRFLPPERCLHR